MKVKKCSPYLIPINMALKMLAFFLNSQLNFISSLNVLGKESIGEIVNLVFQCFQHNMQTNQGFSNKLKYDETAHI